MTAAVADFEVVRMPDAKIKKEDSEGLTLSLHPGPDLLLETKSLREKNGIFTLGFALETEDAIENGRDKMERKGMQLVAVNVANEPGAGFEVETNRISLVHSSGKVEELPLATKEELADQLLDHIESAMDE
jgi:phosphopantothenoylcysteine decarboxylase/phosphopantothenate--cysteine ligase